MTKARYKLQDEYCRGEKKKKLLHGSIKGDSGDRERGSYNKSGVSGKNMHSSNVVRFLCLFMIFIFGIIYYLPLVLVMLSSITKKWEIVAKMAL